MIYTLTFAPALDYQMFLKHIQIGRLNRVEQTSFHVGGKGINVSMVLHHLGNDSICLGFVSGFVGNEIIRLLNEQNICHEFIQTDNGCCRINVKLKAESETELNAFGPPVSRENMERLWQRLRQMKKGDMMIMSGNLPGNIPDSVYQSITEELKKHGVKTIVDASGAALQKAVASGVYLVKPNLAELENLTGKKLEKLTDISAEAQRLRQAGAEYVLVSLGGKGAMLISAKGVWHCQVPRGKLIDSTGAGDSMVAAFAACSCRAMEDEERLRYAVACGSATAYSFELATAENVEALLSLTPPACRLG